MKNAVLCPVWEQAVFREESPACSGPVSYQDRQLPRDSGLGGCELKEPGCRGSYPLTGIPGDISLPHHDSQSETTSKDPESSIPGSGNFRKCSRNSLFLPRFHGEELIAAESSIQEAVVPENGPWNIETKETTILGKAGVNAGET